MLLTVNYHNAQSIINQMKEGLDPSYINTDLDWKRLSRMGVISEDVLDKYKRYWDWYSICMYQRMSKEFIEDHLEYMRWTVLSRTLPEETLPYFDKYLVWSVVATRLYNLSEEFIEKYRHKLEAYIHPKEENNNGYY